MKLDCKEIHLFVFSIQNFFASKLHEHQFYSGKNLFKKSFDFCQISYWVKFADFFSLCWNKKYTTKFQKVNIVFIHASSEAAGTWFCLKYWFLWLFNSSISLKEKEREGEREREREREREKSEREREREREREKKAEQKRNWGKKSRT